MAKVTWYQNLTQMAAGMTTGFVNAFNAIFPAMQAELELRECLFTGFYEPLAAATAGGLVITGSGGSSPVVNLSWPLGKGAVLHGIRIASPAQWAFSGTMLTGTYNLYLDNACQPYITAAASPNSSYLLVATVAWNLSTAVLSNLVPSALAQNSGMTITGIISGGGGGDSVTQVNGVNPDSFGHVTLTASSVGAEAILPTPSAVSKFLTSTTGNVRSWVQVAWSMIASVPSSFTPSSHAGSHEPSGADVIISNDAALGGDSPSQLLAATQYAIQQAIQAATSGVANGLLYKGTWNANVNSPAISSATGTLGWFYKVSVAGNTTVDGNSDWKVGDIILFDGANWDRIAGYEAVSSVLGRTGAVVAVSGDYDVAQIAYATVPTGSGWTGNLSGALQAIYTALAGAVGSISTYLSTFNAASKLVQLDSSARLPAVDGSQLTNLPSGGGGGVASGANLLINGGFDIGQRFLLASSFANGAYAWDQWYALTQTAAITGALLTPSGLTTALNAGRITQAQASAQRVGMAQIIEGVNCIPLIGQTLTAQAQVRCSAALTVRMALLQWTGTQDAPTKSLVNSWTNSTLTPGNFFIASGYTVLGTGNVALSANSYGLLSCQGQPDSSCKNLVLVIWTDSTLAQNATLDVSQADLFAGSATRTWGGVDIQRELQRCQRHYESNYTPNTCCIFLCMAGTGQIDGNFLFKVTKRTSTPVVAAYGYNSSTANVVNAVGGSNITGITAYTASADGVETIYKSGAFTLNHEYAFSISADASMGV